MNPIGLTLPLTRGNTTGYFEQSYDTLEQVKSNIVNLLRTNKGERRMRPGFSSGLQEALFEQNLLDSPEAIKEIIKSKINTWIPGVYIQKIDLNISTDEKNTFIDTYKVYINISFLVNQQAASVSMEFTSNNS
jgi:phage baseplate assembly protein W